MKFLQIYLAVMLTLTTLLLAAIFGVLVYGGIKLAQEIKAVDDKANGLSSQVQSLGDKLKSFNPF